MGWSLSPGMFLATNSPRRSEWPIGFSGGDEPEGSAKLIMSLFRNPRLTDAVHDLLKRRDGLMLGICNGFQALLKLGLVSYGEIRPAAQDSPTLTYNLIGRHQSRLVPGNTGMTTFGRAISPSNTAGERRSQVMGSTFSEVPARVG